jgi:tetratricopeptide (TPR) repeat protein
MTTPDTANPTERPLLQAALTAAGRRDPGRADALFREQLAQDANDGIALGEYGKFCLQNGRGETASYLLYKATRLMPEDIDLLVQLGWAQLQTGKLQAARQSLESALKQSPKHTLANHGIAECYEKLDLWPDAVDAYSVALDGQPDSVPLLTALANACQHQGDLENAAIHYERALRLAPNDPRVLLDYGKFLRDSGAFERAMELFTRCGQLHPDNLAVLLETCRCLRLMGERDRAMALLERIDKLSKGAPEFHEELGNCLTAPSESAQRDLHWGLAADRWLREQQFSKAMPLLEKMLVANPHYATAWNLKGLLHETLQQVDLAEAAFRHAIEADPVWPDAYANLANLYEQVNRIAEAKSMAESAPQVDAARADQVSASLILLDLVLCRVARRQKNYPIALEHLGQIARLKQTDLQREIVSFDRGKVLDGLGDAAGAMSAFSDANALGRIRWISTNPGANKFMAGAEQLLELVGKGWLRQWRPANASPPTATPVFLGGFPRSGTTLLNQVLDSHGDIQIMEELPAVAAMLDAVRTMPRGYANSIRDFDALDIDYMRKLYFSAVATNIEFDPSKLLVDKLPFHLVQAGLIHRVFPDARFLFAVRHPCDVVLSCFMQHFGDNDAMANFFKLKDAVALYARTMDLWEIYQRDLPIAVYRLRYEDLVDDFEGESRRLCDFLGVPWHEDLKEFSVKAMDRGRISTPSYHQVSQPIYRESRYRWERYRNQLMPYLPALRPYILRYGYPDPVRSS